METNIKQLRCGECGEKKHLLYLRENGEVLSECIKCKSVSEIICPKPKMEIYNVTGNGTLCA